MRKAQIYYARMDEFWRKEEKLDYLEKLEHIGNVDWQEIKPDKSYTWLTEGLEDEFENYLLLGNREAKAISDPNPKVIFKLFSLGVSTNRDVWVRNYNIKVLEGNIIKTIEAYNEQTIKWNNCINPSSLNLDNLIVYDDTKISWSSTLKNHLKRGRLNKYNFSQIRYSLYRPFCYQFLYFDEILNDRRGQFTLIFPTSETEKENQVIWLKVGTEVPMFVLTVNCIPDLLPQGGSQCFLFIPTTETEQIAKKILQIGH